ncbi:hypothetical protein [Streptomyces sp. NPDC088400]|uniref:hypothetical protein n=1 Tax=Streptomyces sp. NPDC088400 TaxID=3365861 RepID=UPI003802ABA8
MVEHGSPANYVAWCGGLVGAGGDGSPLFASLGFDLAMTSLWVPLSQGQRVVTMADGEPLELMHKLPPPTAAVTGPPELPSKRCSLRCTKPSRDRSVPW